MPTGLPMILSRLRLAAASNWQFTVGIPSGMATETRTLSAGVWWNDSPTAAESICTEIKFHLDDHPHIAVFTVTYGLETGKFTIASDGETFSITWDSTALRDWMGFTGNLSGANSYTSQSVAQGTLFLGSGREDFPGWQSETDDAVAVAESGAPAGIGSGESREITNWTQAFEPKTWTAGPPIESGCRDDAGTVVPWTAKDWWLHHRLQQGPLRYYADRTGALASYEDGWDLFLHEDMSKITFTPVEPNSHLWFKYKLRVRRYVQAA